MSVTKKTKKSKSAKLEGTSSRRRHSSSKGASKGGDLQANARLLLKRWEIWLREDKKRGMALGLIVLLIIVFATMSRAPSETATPGLKGTQVFADAYGDDEAGLDASEEKPPPKRRRKDNSKTPTPDQFNEDLAKATNRRLALETPAAATDFNVMLRPLEVRGSSVICPDKGGGKENKICSMAYAEYLFDVPKAGVYYLYVETLGPNINDNSLWVGAPTLSNADFTSCPSVKAGALIPHKHVKSKKWLCCPKYLASNAKKGQGAFYCECCISSIGPSGKDVGCILDLEVDENPHWNMLPREFKVTSTADPLPVRLYAREDGTAITRVLLSANPALKSI